MTAQGNEKNLWGTDRTDVGEDFCSECERDGGLHYDRCPLVVTKRPERHKHVWPCPGFWAIDGNCVCDIVSVPEGYCRSCGWVGEVGSRCEDCGDGPLVERRYAVLAAADALGVNRADAIDHAENVDRLVRRGLARPVSPFEVVAELVYDAETDRLEVDR